MTQLDLLADSFASLLPNGIDDALLRVVRSRSEDVTVRDDVVEPPVLVDDLGAMVTVVVDGSAAYAATQDISESGIRTALESAAALARVLRHHALSSPKVALQQSGSFTSVMKRPFLDVTLRDRIDIARDLCRRLARAGDDRIVERRASMWSTLVTTDLVSAHGHRVTQTESHLLPDVSVTAHHDGETLTRSVGIRGRSLQGGLDELHASGVLSLPEPLVDELLELLAAPNCPTGVMDLVLAPDQMMLQIHESIGHPIELDRILGDERNYAGTSFVTLDMFGSYQYGSPLLTVTFAPDVEGELASYAFDDDGSRAERVTLIDKGILVRPLGGALSSARAQTASTANSRASSWNRPAIDRMANLNIEPGTLSKDALIARVENGVMMETNCSWSIDDARDKFQFGCERGRIIKDGVLGDVVKKPAYRGRSQSFWRSLVGVGDADSFEILGTPYCGKGEPNQAIRVGHASPICHFTNVEVFGGE